MAEWFKVNVADMDGMQKIMEELGNSAEQTINDILHGEGAEEIKKNIQSILPVSGRKRWRGKKAAAKSAKPFEQKNDNLSVTVLSRGHYHYLYFPDDGSNTVRHVGNQQFMRRGAETSAEKIMEMCTEKIVEKFK